MSIKDIFEFVVNFNLLYLLIIPFLIWMSIYLFGVVKDFIKAFREGYNKDK
jgi:hypothetical protein